MIGCLGFKGQFMFQMTVLTKDKAVVGRGGLKDVWCRNAGTSSVYF